MRSLTFSHTALGPGDRESVASREVLFLHGFPGVRSRQNRDIAEVVARETGSSCEVLLYPGLGQVEGVFSFARCLEDVREHVAGLTKSRPDGSFDLVGHSWGGFMALVMAVEHPRAFERLVLMSPLLRFANVASLEPWFDDSVKRNPELKLEPAFVLAKEFAEFDRTLDPMHLISMLPPSLEVLFLQAKDDPVTSERFAQAAKARFAMPIEFEEVATDHSFVVDRPQIALRIARFLKR